MGGAAPCGAPISVPIGAAPWPHHGCSSPSAHLPLGNGVPRASEATTPPCTEAAVPSPMSALGFCGCHFPVHVIRLPVIVLIWASCWGRRCFSRDSLWGPAGRRSDGLHGHTQPCSPCQSAHPGLKLPDAMKQRERKSALDGVSVLALGFARDLSHPGAEQATPSPQLDAQPAQQDPSSEGQGH